MEPPNRNGCKQQSERRDISSREMDSTSRRSKKHVSIKQPENGETEEEPASSLRRTRTLPPQMPESPRRSRRNLSRRYEHDLGEEASPQRIGSAPSGRRLKPTLSKKAAASPLDIPFVPNAPMSRALSAETKFDDLMRELRDIRTEVQKTKTQVLRDEASVAMPQDASPEVNPETIENRLCNGLPASTAHLKIKTSLERDSARDLRSSKASKKGNRVIRQDTALDDLEKQEHYVISVDAPSKTKEPLDKTSAKIVKSNSSKKAGKPKELPPLTWVELMLHFIGLIFVQYPFKYHKQWLEKMYKTNRIQRPANYKRPLNQAPRSTALNSVRNEATLPTLSEHGTGYTYRNARIRRKTQLDGDDGSGDFSSSLDGPLGNRAHRQSNQFPVMPIRPPPGHLPRSQNISEERRRKKSRKSTEIFGDMLSALGINAKGGRLKMPFGLSEMDESELTGFQARLYKFIKRQHKGRLARAWDHMTNPLGSMQRKHRRSSNKARLLNAIDKDRAHKYDSLLDKFKTRLFLLGQWMFEALSPPKYTKKPMLFTVLFPLLLILFFGFMAGEYPHWRTIRGDEVEYKFGPEELTTWIFRTEEWRNFDDDFLIVWGARYLPMVSSESWRWLFSLLVHENFAHLGGNLLLFVVLSWSLESKYGFFRTALICWLSGISGNFMSAVLEDACGIVLGASGCIFGLAGFYVVDVIGDFKRVSFPCLRLIGIFAFLIIFIIALTSHQQASHFSHIGGFIGGLGLSVVLVPHFIDERVEAFLPWVALFSALGLLCILPLVVFISVIPDLQCGS